MKSQSLPKKLTFAPGKIQPEVGEVGWSPFLKPIDQSMPQHSFQCECEMCNKYEYNKFKQALEEQSKTINYKIRTRVNESNFARKLNTEEHYQWIIKHLALPQHKIATNGLNIRISQSLFFKDGQANQLYLNKQIQDPTIKKIQKQKLNNAFVQKLMTERRRKYKDYIRIKTGRKKAEQKKKLFFGQKQVKKQIKDAVLIRYIDGYEQLLTQNQFLGMFLKRKQDPIWKQIVSIRNFINITNPQEQKSRYLVTKYKRDKIKYEDLFNRSKILIKIYGEYIISQNDEYISSIEELQFCKQLQKQNLQMYAEYLTYQIVNFIEYFYDQQINTLVIGIYFDQIGFSFLNQVYKLSKKSLVKFAWTQQIYRKKMDEQSTRVLESKEILNESAYEEASQNIVKVMHTAYEKMRDHYGLTARDEDNKEEVANNNFFKKMHPGFNQNISDVLKNPNLGVNQFRSKFLGIKSARKPIIKEFTSNMIKTIHLTSPRLRSSQPHAYIASPKKYTPSTINFTQRKRDNIFLSPIKINSSLLSKTLPMKQTI